MSQRKRVYTVALGALSLLLSVLYQSTAIGEDKTPITKRDALGKSKIAAQALRGDAAKQLSKRDQLFRYRQLFNKLSTGVEVPADVTIWKNQDLLDNALAIAQNEFSTIFGGVIDEDNQFPEAVAVGHVEKRGGQSVDVWTCSGTLYGSDLVVTAAHCAGPGEVPPTQVCFGLYTTQGVKISVKSFVPHPQYDRFSHAHDVMVLHLEKDAEQAVIGLHARRIAAGNDVDAARSIEIVGFGSTNVNGTPGNSARVRALCPVATTSCPNVPPDWHAKFGCNPNEIVAGCVNGKVDACGGDSGGGCYIVPAGGGAFLLCGVASRPTNNAVRACGDGGVWDRIDGDIVWLKQQGTANTRWP